MAQRNSSQVNDVMRTSAFLTALVSRIRGRMGGSGRSLSGLPPDIIPLFKTDGGRRYNYIAQIMRSAPLCGPRSGVFNSIYPNRRGRRRGSVRCCLMGNESRGAILLSRVSVIDIRSLCFNWAAIYCVRRVPVFSWALVRSRGVTRKKFRKYI